MATKNTGKKEKGAYGLPKGSSEAPAWQETVGTTIAGQAEIDEVDKVAIAMEKKWGRDRLRLVVGPDLREKFDRQRYLLNQAIWHGDLQKVIAGLRDTVSTLQHQDAIKDGLLQEFEKTHNGLRETMTNLRHERDIAEESLKD